MIEVTFKGIIDRPATEVRVDMPAVPRIGEGIWINGQAYQVEDVKWSIHLRPPELRQDVFEYVVVELIQGRERE